MKKSQEFCSSCPECGSDGVISKGDFLFRKYVNATCSGCGSQFRYKCTANRYQIVLVWGLFITLLFLTWIAFDNYRNQFLGAVVIVAFGFVNSLRMILIDKYCDIQFTVDTLLKRDWHSERMHKTRSEKSTVESCKSCNVNLATSKMDFYENEWFCRPCYLDKVGINVYHNE